MYTKNQYTYRGHTGAVLDLAVGPEAEALFYSASTDRTIKVWDIVGEHCLHTLQHANPMCKVVAERRLMICADINGMVEVPALFSVRVALPTSSPQCPCCPRIPGAGVT